MPFFPQFSNLFVPPFVPTSTLLNGLSSYWNLDNDSWLDSTANGRTLTNTDGVTNGTGIINDGAEFDGSAQYLSRSSYPLTENLSVSVWVKCGSQTDYTALFNFLAPVDIGAYVNPPATNNNFGVYISGTWNNSLISINDSLWHHVVITLNAGNAGSTLKCYVDGTLVIENGGVEPNIQTITLAIGFNGSEYYMNGTLDEFGVWDRVLTQSEVTQLYNSGIGLSYPFS